MASRPRSEHAREAVALLLARGLTQRQAAQKAGVSEKSIHNWLHTPEFAAQVAELRGRLVSDAVAVLSGLSRRAAARLGRLIGSENERVALRASVSVIEMMIKLREHVDLAERMTALEALLRDQGAAPASVIKPRGESSP
jgi:transposase